MTRARLDEQQRLALDEEAGNDVTAQLQRLQGMAVQGLLEGVPDDVAESVTEREFEAVVAACAAARGEPVKVAATEEPEKNE